MHRKVSLILGCWPEQSSDWLERDRVFLNVEFPIEKEVRPSAAVNEHITA